MKSSMLNGEHSIAYLFMYFGYENHGRFIVWRNYVFQPPVYIFGSQCKEVSV